MSEVPLKRHNLCFDRTHFSASCTLNPNPESRYEFSDNNYSGADMIGPYCFKRTLGKGAEGVVKLAINTQVL